MIKEEKQVKQRKVILIKEDNCSYPSISPFRPSKKYPEYPFDEISEQNNNVYDMVRNGLLMMKYDFDNFGKRNWNPLGEIIKPNDVVLIKPNLVMHENQIKENGVLCLYTQPSLIAPIIDYVVIALNGVGKIVVGDAPMQECDFESLIEKSGYKELMSFYSEKLKNTNITIELIDFRELRSRSVKGVMHSSISSTDGKVIDLKDQSEFYGESDYFFENARITNYDPNILKKHHNKERNEYYISDYVINADVIINVPKPKTHRKAGITASLKNVVGICCRKEYLPHHTNGSKLEGGDEYLNNSVIKKVLDKLSDVRNIQFQTKKSYKVAWFLKKVYNYLLKMSNLISLDSYYEGSWYGNDTISRTIVDLNKILFYSDKNGIMRKSKQRQYLIVADMIISGEGEGPVAPSPRETGMIAISEDPVCFDETILWFMGAKKEYIKTIYRARNQKGHYSLTEKDSCPIIFSNIHKWNNKCLEELSNDDKLYLKPTSGWVDAFFTNE